RLLLAFSEILSGFYRILGVVISGAAKVRTHAHDMGTVIERRRPAVAMICGGVVPEGRRQRLVDSRFECQDFRYTVPLLNLGRIERLKVANAPMQPLDPVALLLD